MLSRPGPQGKGPSLIKKEKAEEFRELWKKLDIGTQAASEWSTIPAVRLLEMYRGRKETTPEMLALFEIFLMFPETRKYGELKTNRQCFTCKSYFRKKCKLDWESVEPDGVCDLWRESKRRK